jgi:hypothetical protein
MDPDLFSTPLRIKGTPLGLLLKSQPRVASSLPCTVFLVSSPENTSLGNHLFLNPHFKVCFREANLAELS